MTVSKLSFFFAAVFAAHRRATTTAAAVMTVDDSGLLEGAAASDGRELFMSYECQDHGREVPVSERCCRETEHVHSMIKRQSDLGNDVCQQINMAFLLSPTQKEEYCEISPNGNFANCTFDVQKDNPSCAQETLDVCTADGGKLFASDIVMACDGLLLTTKNSLSCLGTDCRDDEAEEFLWAGIFARQDMGTCRVLSVNGKRRYNDDRTQLVDSSRYNNEINSESSSSGGSGTVLLVMLLPVFVVAFIAGYFAAKASVSHNSTRAEPTASLETSSREEQPVSAPDEIPAAVANVGSSDEEETKPPAALEAEFI